MEELLPAVETSFDRQGAFPALRSCQRVACALARLVDDLSERLPGCGQWAPDRLSWRLHLYVDGV